MSELMQKIERATGSPFYDQIDRKEDSGRDCKSMRVLLEATCSFDCAYCGVCGKQNGISFTPKELSRDFLSLHHEGKVGGLLLSTGIPRGDVALGMEKLTETARLIRSDGHLGYLHLKVLPGAARTDIAELAKYATRLSINLEAPSTAHLAELATVKNYRSDLLTRHHWLAELMPGHHSTQFVVGAADETDADIYHTVCSWSRGRDGCRHLSHGCDLVRKVSSCKGLLFRILCNQKHPFGKT
ncbi:MAG: hypothetical protein LBU24_00890 [Methanocalculaceae archaeon]|nr:hypothetical protein [Methanocalculaceae archaeon]